jgi:hypothetical protein
MRFENLQRHENHKERYAGLDPLDSTVTEKNRADRYGDKHQFQNDRAKPVIFGFHPKFESKRNEKKPWNPNGERVEERR